MKNRFVGILIICVAALMGFIVYSFNAALTDIVSEACTHGPACPMWGTIEFQTNVSIGIIVFVVLIGLYLVFFGKEERIVTKIKIRKENRADRNRSDEINERAEKRDYSEIAAKLNSDEKAVFEKIIEAKGAIFQSELVEKTNFTKVKMTRILDRLEGRGLIERKRRGMTNMVVLRH